MDSEHYGTEADQNKILQDIGEVEMALVPDIVKVVTQWIQDEVVKRGRTPQGAFLGTGHAMLSLGAMFLGNGLGLTMEEAEAICKQTKTIYAEAYEQTGHDRLISRGGEQQ